MATQQRDNLSGVTAIVYDTMAYNPRLKRRMPVERRYVLGRVGSIARDVLAECQHCFSIEGTVARLTGEGYAHFERGLREEGVGLEERGGRIYLKAPKRLKQTPGSSSLILPEEEVAAAVDFRAETKQPEAPVLPEEWEVNAVLSLLSGDRPEVPLVRGHTTRDDLEQDRFRY